MSVQAVLNMDTGEWQFAVAPETPAPWIRVGFTSEVLPVRFDGLSFGWVASVGGVEVASESYPKDGGVYVSTDQPYVSDDVLFASPDDEVVLTVSAQNGGETFQDAVSFVVPRPDRPYSSWVWEDGGWVAPVPYPDGGGFYSWDEDGGVWVPVEGDD